MCFEGDLGRLKEYFLTRNHPKHVIEEAFGKLFSISMDDALKPTSPKKCQDIISFVCSYNPSLPNIGIFINQYWNLLKYSKSGIGGKCVIVNLLMLTKDLQIYKMLIHSQLNRTVNAGYRPRCSHCSSIIESNSLFSTTASASFSIRENFTCASSEVNLITCKKCKIQCVGQTQQKCSQGMNKHKFDIKHFPDIITTDSDHFNSPRHSIKDFSFMPIDKVTGNWKRLMKETSWMHRLGTVCPVGLNSKIMY